MPPTENGNHAKSDELANSDELTKLEVNMDKLNKLAAVAEMTKSAELTKLAAAEVVVEEKQKSMRGRTGLHIQTTWARRVIQQVSFKPTKKTKNGEDKPKKRLIVKARLSKYAPLALASFAEASLRIATSEAFARVADADMYTLKPVHFVEARHFNPTLQALFPGFYLIENAKRAAPVKKENGDNDDADEDNHDEPPVKKQKLTGPKNAKKKKIVDDGKPSLITIELAEGGKIELV
jgi:hypothetical protein